MADNNGAEKNNDNSGSPSKKKPAPPLKYKQLKKHCSAYFKEFTSNTSLHGIKYVGEKRPAIEKIWWGIMIFLCVIACSFLIFKIWRKWDEKPVIVTFAETSTPIWQIPFPAVTVCSETKIKNKFMNITKYFHKLRSGNMTEEERYRYDIISMVCDINISKLGNKTVGEEAIKMLTENAPTKDEMLLMCRWKNRDLNCTEFFSPILTEDGLCFTFNMLKAEELFQKEILKEDNPYLNHHMSSDSWNLEDGYADDSSLYSFPQRGTGSGIGSGLTILFRALDWDVDYLCRGPVLGYKILLHSPADIPQVGNQYFRVPLHQEVLASVKPNMMTTSEGLRGYNPERRQCYFPSERRLKFFKIYTQNNCEIECLTNYTMAMCGCVKFSMPRDSSMPICSAGSFHCAKNATDDLLTGEIKRRLNRSKSNLTEEYLENERILDEIANNCKCLASCTAIKYDTEISQATYDWKKLLDAFGSDQDEIKGYLLSRVVIFFQESQFIPSRRSELYGIIDFLANCGGILGLCLGFSVLSLVEIIYFITLRAISNMKKRKNKIASRKESEATIKGKESALENFA